MEQSYINDFHSWADLKAGLQQFFSQWKDTDISVSIKYFNLMQSIDDRAKPVWLIVVIYSLDAIQEKAVICGMAAANPGKICFFRGFFITSACAFLLNQFNQ